MKTYFLYRIKYFILISFFAHAFIWGFLPASAAGGSHALPERIISLGPIITETIYLLGADKKLIANTTYCVLPPDARLKEKIGTVIQMNVEKIISLSPDLVLANALTKQKQINILESLGIRVVKFENPKTFSEMCQMTLKIGRVLGKEEKAKQIIEKTRKEVDAVIEKTGKLLKKRVFIQIGIKPLHTAVKETFVNEYIELAGGENIALNEKSGVYSREKVLQENPDVIFIATMGSSRTAGENEKAGWMKFRSITASRNNEIFILDPDIICSPTPVSFVKALKEIAKKLHPDIGLTE
ncbi:MAG: ABC transporter substrate-binding protein [Deltaproteobacteria bacterium]|nr:ABC transporter substrate-binding protein [Deltaproteobacteria bacterium]